MSTEDSPKPRRWRLRFSLQSLVLAVCLFGALVLPYPEWPCWRRVQPLPKPVKYAEFTSDGQKLLTRYTDGEITLWDSGTREPIKRLDVGSAGAVAFSPTGRCAATYNVRSSSTITVWDLETGEQRISWNVPRGIFCVDRSVQFSQDNRILITLAWGRRTIQVWDARTGEVQATIQSDNPELAFLCAAISPDGRWVATADHHFDTFSNDISIWNAGTARQVDTFTHQGNAHYLAFVDARRVFLASWSSLGHIIDIENGRRLTALNGLARSVRYAGLLADGRTLATVCPRGNRQEWDVETGVETAREMREVWRDPELLDGSGQLVLSPRGDTGVIYGLPVPSGEALGKSVFVVPNTGRSTHDLLNGIHFLITVSLGLLLAWSFCSIRFGPWPTRRLRRLRMAGIVLMAMVLLQEVSYQLFAEGRMTEAMLSTFARTLRASGPCSDFLCVGEHTWVHLTPAQRTFLDEQLKPRWKTVYHTADEIPESAWLPATEHSARSLANGCIADVQIISTSRWRFASFTGADYERRFKTAHIWLFGFWIAIRDQAIGLPTE